jgi:4-hydroxybenzoate polyprenyltransferase
MHFEKFELESVHGDSPERRKTGRDGTFTDAVQSGAPSKHDATPTEGRRTFSREALRYVALFGMSLVIGLLVALVLATIIDTWLVFALGVFLGLVVLYQKDTTRGTVGTGLYVSALLVVLVPVGQYGLSIFAAPDGQGTLGPWSAIEGVLGLVFGLVIAVVIAAVVATVGYAFNRWAPATSR